MRFKSAKTENVIYWLCSGIAVLVLAITLAYLGVTGGFTQEGIIWAIFFGSVAAGIWLVGRVCLYLLAGR